MANTVTITQMEDTQSVTTTHVYLASDGASGDLTNVVIQDSSVLSGGNPMYQIVNIQGCFNGFSATINFDQTTPFKAIVCPQDRKFCYSMEPDDDFTFPIQNPNGTGTTGDVTISTSGFTAAADIGWLLITTLKKYTPANTYSGG